jgi:hypothetical protein
MVYKRPNLAARTDVIFDNAGSKRPGDELGVPVDKSSGKVLMLAD